MGRDEEAFAGPRVVPNLGSRTALVHEGPMKTLHREEGMTIVTVTHDWNGGVECCEQVFGLRDGRLLREGSPREFVDQNWLRDLYDVNFDLIVQGDRRWLVPRELSP